MKERILTCGTHPVPSDAFDTMRDHMERSARREFALGAGTDIVWPTVRVTWTGTSVCVTGMVANG